MAMTPLPAPEAENVRLRAMLARCEWAGDFCDEAACPLCLARYFTPHAPDCPLDALLQGRPPGERPAIVDIHTALTTTVCRDCGVALEWQLRLRDLPVWWADHCGSHYTLTVETVRVQRSKETVACP